MSRLFRSPAAGRRGYLALALFAAAYLAALGLVVAPETIVDFAAVDLVDGGP